jgi:hypothetical protein
MVVGGVAGLGGAGAGATTWDGLDVGCADGIGASDDEAGAVCCAIALNPISREAVSIHFQVRITKILSARA